MKRKKGFTLIELLAVIAIIGILTLILYPSINGILLRSKEDAYNVQIENIEMAASKWAYKNAVFLPTDQNAATSIPLKELKKGGYIQKDLKDPITKKKFPNDMMVVVTRIGNSYTYKVDKTSGSKEENEDTGSPTLILNGLRFEFIEIGTSYLDKGVKGLDASGNAIPNSSIVKTITKNGTTVNSIDTNSLSQYEITYKVTINGKTERIQRNVKVRDTIGPKITVPLNTSLSTIEGSFDVLAGVTVEDNSRERINVEATGAVALHVPGVYVITYKAKDSSGNETVRKRTVTITGFICPVLQVKGTTVNAVWTTSNVTLNATYVNGTDLQGDSYQWQKLVSGVWTNIVGATGKSYTETADINTQYRIVYASQSNCTGNSNAYAVRIDKTNPTCGSVNGASTSWTRGSRTITQNCSDSGSGCTQDAYAKTYTTNTRTDSIVIQDKVGHTVTCPNYNVYVDVKAPNTPGISSTTNGGCQKGGSINVSASSSDNLSGISYWQTSWNGSSWSNVGSASNSYSTSISGTQTRYLYVRSIDRAGNVSGTNNTYICIQEPGPPPHTCSVGVTGNVKPSGVSWSCYGGSCRGASHTSHRNGYCGVCWANGEIRTMCKKSGTKCVSNANFNCPISPFYPAKVPD